MDLVLIYLGYCVCCYVATLFCYDYDVLPTPIDYFLPLLEGGCHFFLQGLSVWTFYNSVLQYVV